MQTANLAHRLIYHINYEAQQGSIFFTWKYSTNPKIIKLLAILLSEGVLLHSERQPQNRLKLYLNYKDGSSAALCSKPAQHRTPARYVNHITLTRFMAMRPGATVLLSTPKGIVTHKECIKHKIGGFYFCHIKRN